MVIIDPYRGGEDTGFIDNDIIEKDFNLLISEYIFNRLKELGVETILTRNIDKSLSIDDRADIIKNAYNDNSNVIAISNRLNYGDENGVEIIYSLRNSNALSNRFEDAFKERNIKVNKVFQKRDENDTSKDYDDLLKKTDSVQTIIINYGYINDEEDSYNIKNNYKKYGESIVKAIASLYNIPYIYNNENEYIVKKGDTLYSIAKRFGLTVDELKKNNNLNSNIININDVLDVSNKSINGYDYIVKKGDTLYSIAKSNNTTVDNIKKINNLNSNLLSIGQLLIIPNNQKIYIVKKGDTLYSIAKNNNTTVDDIKRKNNLNSNLLSIGQKIVL